MMEEVVCYKTPIKMPSSPPQPRTCTCSNLHGHICEITSLLYHDHFPGAFFTEISHADFLMGGIRDPRGGEKRARAVKNESCVNEEHETLEGPSWKHLSLSLAHALVESIVGSMATSRDTASGLMGV